MIKINNKDENTTMKSPIKSSTILQSFFDNNMDLEDNKTENKVTKLRTIQAPKIRFKNKTKKSPKIQLKTSMKNDISPIKNLNFINNAKSILQDSKNVIQNNNFNFKHYVKENNSPKLKKKLSKLELMILESQKKIDKENKKIKEKRMKRISVVLNKSNKNYTTFYKDTSNSKRKKVLLTPNLEKELINRKDKLQKDINSQPKHLINNKNKEIEKRKPTKPIAFNFSSNRRKRTQSISPRKIISNKKKLQKKQISKKFYTPKKTKPISPKFRTSSRIRKRSTTIFERNNINNKNKNDKKNQNPIKITKRNLTKSQTLRDFKSFKNETSNVLKVIKSKKVSVVRGGAILNSKRSNFPLSLKVNKGAPGFMDHTMASSIREYKSVNKNQNNNTKPQKLQKPQKSKKLLRKKITNNENNIFNRLYSHAKSKTNVNVNNNDNKFKKNNIMRRRSMASIRTKKKSFINVKSVIKPQIDIKSIIDKSKSNDNDTEENNTCENLYLNNISKISTNNNKSILSKSLSAQNVEQVLRNIKNDIQNCNLSEDKDINDFDEETLTNEIDEVISMSNTVKSFDNVNLESSNLFLEIKETTDEHTPSVESENDSSAFIKIKEITDTGSHTNEDNFEHEVHDEDTIEDVFEHPLEFLKKM